VRYRIPIAFWIKEPVLNSKVLAASVYNATNCVFNTGMIRLSKQRALPLASAHNRPIDDSDSYQSSDYPLHPEHELLEERIRRIFRELEQVIMSPSYEGNIDSQKTALAKAKRLLSVSNALRFTEAYFATWHTNCPLLHESTFDPCSVSLSLWLSVILMGAAYSPVHSHTATTQGIADIAERYIFQMLELSGDSLLNDYQPLSTSILHLQVLQSAAITVVAQNFQGTSRARLRVRKTSLSKLVEVWPYDLAEQSLNIVVYN
jgi:Fungal specific transcription factor domain